MGQGLRFGFAAGPVGVLPCPSRHAWIVSPRTWSFSSAVRRCSVWPRPLLYAAEVALKLQTSPTSSGGFFQVRFGKAESVLAVKFSLFGEISTRAVVSTTCMFTICVLTTCMYTCFTEENGPEYTCFTEDLRLGVYLFHRGKPDQITGVCGKPHNGSGVPPESGYRRLDHQLSSYCRRNRGGRGREYQHALGSRIVQIRPS